MQQIASLHLQAAFVDEYQCHNQLKDWHLKCQSPFKLVCSELQNVKASLWLVDVLQTQRFYDTISCQRSLIFA